MYYVVFGLLYVLSLLPLRVLYLLSDLAYVIVYYALGYRKGVVLHNLSIAFPEKTERERIAIAKKFYHNFTDTFIETIKFISATPAFFRKRFTADFEDMRTAWATGRSVQVHVGHNFNWELVNLAMPPYLPGKLIGVYMPLHNKTFERLFRYIRTRFGTELVRATRMKDDMLSHRGTQYIIGLVADQSPPRPERTFWINFFNKPTGFLNGPENYARRNNFPVLFAHFTKVRRGYYQGHMELATLNSAELSPGELTVRYAKYLERIMREQPEMWLWSHRRWKREWKPEYGEPIG